MASFFVFGAASTAAVVAHAAVKRGRLFATFAGVFMGVHTLAATAFASALSPWPLRVAFGAANALVYGHFFALARPAWRPRWYRALVSVPAHTVLATTLLALPFVGATALGAPSLLLTVPVALGAFGLLESLSARRDVFAIDVDRQEHGALRRKKLSRTEDDESNADALRVVQITDPHLGTFMSVDRLRSICERAVAMNPDLVLLTGDFLTMESQSDPSLLAEALSPLESLKGRTFACMGNHDHEAPSTVLAGLRSAGVELLIDDVRTAHTRLGEVEILGLDFRFRDRKQHIEGVCREFPRKPGLPRIAMLHDPGAFVHMPEGSAELVLSGHTHGGQVGLLRLGLPHTFVSALTKIPDHGLWSRGRELLYVHRGSGHYGFPLRVGVPSEESLLLVRGLFSA
ncbi:MAG: metallophosphoesterase [Polyangiales bacterium]